MSVGNARLNSEILPSITGAAVEALRSDVYTTVTLRGAADMQRRSIRAEQKSIDGQIGARYLRASERAIGACAFLSAARNGHDTKHTSDNY